MKRSKQFFEGLLMEQPGTLRKKLMNVNGGLLFITLRSSRRDNVTPQVGLG